MARRALKGVNWAAIAERISESERTAYASLKSKYDGYLQRMSALSESPMKIDWATYKKHVPVAGMVEKFQKEYESLKVPYPADNYTAAIDAQLTEALAAVQQFITESNNRIQEAEAEVTKLRNMIPFDQMTMEDYAEAYPEEAINLDKPTIWPHTPDDQPDDRDVPAPMPKPEH